MSAPWIEFGTMRYLIKEIASGTVDPGAGEFQRSVWEFTRDWFSTKTHFTLFTSGSTGLPKEITVARGAMAASASNTARALNLRAGSTAMLCLDPKHIAGKMMLVRSFETGMNIVAVEPCANPIAALGADAVVDFTAVVPYQLQTILTSPADTQRLNSIETILVGGAAFDLALEKKIASLTGAVYATYGMTETLSHIALQKLNPPGAQDYFQVLDGITVEQDDRGCLIIRASYLGCENIITNDLVELLSPGRFRWLGRYDNIINTGGIKVLAEKIEKTISVVFDRQRITNRFFVTGLPDARLGTQVALFMEGTPPAEMPDIVEILRPVLTRFEVPKTIRWVPRFAQTETLKVNRKQTVDLAR